MKVAAPSRVAVKPLVTTGGPAYREVGATDALVEALRQAGYDLLAFQASMAAALRQVASLAVALMQVASRQVSSWAVA